MNSQRPNSRHQPARGSPRPSSSSHGGSSRRWMLIAGGVLAAVVLVVVLIVVIGSGRGTPQGPYQNNGTSTKGQAGTDSGGQSAPTPAAQESAGASQRSTESSPTDAGSPEEGSRGAPTQPERADPPRQFVISLLGSDGREVGGTGLKVTFAEQPVDEDFDLDETEEGLAKRQRKLVKETLTKTPTPIRRYLDLDAAFLVSFDLRLGMPDQILPGSHKVERDTSSDTPLVFRIPARMLWARVVGKDGEPLENATLIIPISMEENRRSTDHKDGRHSIVVPDGQRRVVVSAVGHAETVFPIPESLTDDPLVFRLEPDIGRTTVNIDWQGTVPDDLATTLTMTLSGIALATVLDLPTALPLNSYTPKPRSRVQHTILDPGTTTKRIAGVATHAALRAEFWSFDLTAKNVLNSEAVYDYVAFPRTSVVVSVELAALHRGFTTVMMSPDGDWPWDGGRKDDDHYETMKPGEVATLRVAPGRWLIRAWHREYDPVATDVGHLVADLPAGLNRVTVVLATSSDQVELAIQDRIADCASVGTYFVEGRHSLQNVVSAGTDVTLRHMHRSTLPLEAKSQELLRVVKHSLAMSGFHVLPVVTAGFVTVPRGISIPLTAVSPSGKGIFAATPDFDRRVMVISRHQGQRGDNEAVNVTLDLRYTEDPSRIAGPHSLAFVPPPPKEPLGLIRIAQFDVKELGAEYRVGTRMPHNSYRIPLPEAPYFPRPESTLTEEQLASVTLSLPPGTYSISIRWIVGELPNIDDLSTSASPSDRWTKRTWYGQPFTITVGAKKDSVHAIWVCPSAK